MSSPSLPSGNAPTTVPVSSSSDDRDRSRSREVAGGTSESDTATQPTTTTSPTSTPKPSTTAENIPTTTTTGATVDWLARSTDQHQQRNVSHGASSQHHPLEYPHRNVHPRIPSATMAGIDPDPGHDQWSTKPDTNQDDVVVARGPAPAHRQAGPSLLSQALALSRSTPPSSPSDVQRPADPGHGNADELSDSRSSTPTNTPRDSRQGRASNTTSLPSPSLQKPPEQHERTGVSALSLSRSSTMAAAAPLAAFPASTGFPNYDSTPKAPSLHHPPLANARDVRSSIADKTRDYQTSTSLKIDSSVAIRAATSPLPSPNPYDTKTPTKETFTESRPPITGSRTEEACPTETRPQPRPRPGEHRFTAPEKTEKIWSIGSGEGPEEDGQVEKSVAEAMAGVEPNARSRKASYSLRFFKEGMPADDRIRRRDTDKVVVREKLSPTKEEDEAVTSRAPADDMDLMQSVPADQVLTPSKLTRSRSFPARGQVMEANVPPPFETDYFDLVPTETHDRTTPSSRNERARTRDDELAEATSLLRLRSKSPTKSADAYRRSDETVEAADSQDDLEADESGEEKISSAVFVPHHEIAESPVSESVPPSPSPSGPRPRSLSQSKTHPWLVKADEPEPEPAPEVRDFGEESLDRAQSQSEPAAARQPKPKPFLLPAAEFAVEDEPEPAPGIIPKTYHAAKPQDVVDDLPSPQQPLEAIELIPYKHQVGGHTTLWRFSRRAVCKQLNNRENEFYETIERYHRDLLPFLPRYIGVLNVTFQKQPRRKSTTKNDEAAASERQKIREQVSAEMANAQQHSGGLNGTMDDARHDAVPARIISHSMAKANGPIPTVTFHDNRHILPRNLLQPTASPVQSRPKSMSSAGKTSPKQQSQAPPRSRPHLDERPNSWGATTVNKRLRNEVFNDVFLKQPVEVQKHRRPDQKSIPRQALQRMLRATTSDPNLIRASRDRGYNDAKEPSSLQTADLGHNGTHSKMGLHEDVTDVEREVPANVKDISGTSAPEPETLKANPLAVGKKKRRFSAGGLRRKPEDVRESRGDLKYFEEADDVEYKGDYEDLVGAESLPTVSQGTADMAVQASNGASHPSTFIELNPSNATSTVVSELPSPSAEFRKIPRPINPKEAKSQRDRVEYFLLLEDLTANMKRPCMMDLKMGTRQYGVDATAKKQKSQQNKCRSTTSAELGVRICGVQVWNAMTESYDFQDKYFGRQLKVGNEFQNALQKFLYNGVDLHSVLHHIPVILRKIAKLEQIVHGLRGYRFYAASLLMFYDGDASDDGTDYETAYESATDVATDTEDGPRRRQKKNPREIDFKIADFANSVTPLDKIEDKPCPPTHPSEPDVGFLKGLRSLRKYFLQIQKDVRDELGLGSLPGRVSTQVGAPAEMYVEEDEGMMSL